MLSALITFAAEAGAEPSKTFFYICGGALVVWALVLSAIGIRAHESWPPTQSAARAVMSISVGLVLLAMASAVITS
jgi:membrane protein DedA with SNARE-associated domain